MGEKGEISGVYVATKEQKKGFFSMGENTKRKTTSLGFSVGFFFVECTNYRAFMRLGVTISTKNGIGI
jgi:hypothetical protein